VQTTVLLSVKPRFANAILDGTKQFEFRRTLFRDRSVQTVILYASRPVSQVVGEFKIAEIMTMDLVDLWTATQHGSGIDKSYFDEYFQGRETGHAIRVKVPRRYHQPLDLERDLHIAQPPQSFRYVKCTTIPGSQ
jgi:predicted transcriptional regulator